MTTQRTIGKLMRLPASALLLAMSGALAGCSTDFASVDDVYVPASVEENHPINVEDRQVKLTVAAGAHGLEPGAAAEVAAFASKAAATPAKITVAYPSGSSKARSSAVQAAAILGQQGIARSRISVTSYGGQSNVVALSYTARVAVTKPCGSWPENLRANRFNEPQPEFGCVFQQNFAAMVSNPDDLLHARAMPPARSADQAASLKKIQDGTWITPTTDTSLSTGSN